MHFATAALAFVTFVGCGRYGFEDSQSLLGFVDCDRAAATDHCYALVLEPADWQSAQDACQVRLGPMAHLVTIDGPAENDWAFRYADSIPYGPVDDNPNQRQRMWTGGNDLDTVGEWTWITGEPFAYANWRADEPGSPGEEQCMIVLGEYDGQWDDRPCDDAYEYLCEREAS